MGSLTALKVLKLERSRLLKRPPPLVDLGTLQKLKMKGCEQLQRLPLPDNLTASVLLGLWDLMELQKFPSLASLCLLQKL
jgi:hypothetical protein